MKAMQCEKCGGHINPSTLRCEYCGTQYEDDGMGRLYITRFDPKMDVLCSNVSFDWDFVSSNDDPQFTDKGETITQVMTFNNIYDVRLMKNNTVALLNKDCKIDTLISLDKITYLRSEPMYKGHSVEFDLYGGDNKI